MKLNSPSHLFFITAFLLVLTTILTSLTALGEEQSTPISITANTLTIENKKGISTYQGNVQITQGDNLLKGNIVTVMTNKSNKVTRIIATETGHKLAYFQEKNNDNVTIKAWGKEIVYDVKNEIIQLTEKAKLFQKDNLFTGHFIEYDQKTEQVKANTKRGDASKQRVKISILPNS